MIEGRNRIGGDSSGDRLGDDSFAVALLVECPLVVLNEDRNHVAHFSVLTTAHVIHAVEDHRNGGHGKP